MKTVVFGAGLLGTVVRLFKALAKKGMQTGSDKLITPDADPYGRWPNERT